MKLKTILESYPIEVLEKIAANKISDITHLKLPKQALIQELCEILCSHSYISAALSLRQPPCFTIINTLLEQDDYCYDVLSFKPKVLDETESLQRKAAAKVIFQPEFRKCDIESASARKTPSINVQNLQMEIVIL